MPLKSRKLLVFSSKSCVPCKAMHPLLQEIKEKDKINILEISTDDDLKSCVEHSVMGVPTLIILEDGKEVKRQVGALSKKELEKFIE